MTQHLLHRAGMLSTSVLALAALLGPVVTRAEAAQGSREPVAPVEEPAPVEEDSTSSSRITSQTASAPSPWDPDWASAPTLRVIGLFYDSALSPQSNGAILKTKAQALIPGDTLVVGGGTWVVDSFFTINRSGTAAAPIRIVGVPGKVVRITRSDAYQNVINLGSGGQARYLSLSNLEITGGSSGLRLFDASQIWIDGCYIHHVGGVGIAANTHNVDRLHITRNHISHTADTAEGMYLGANFGTSVMSNSVIARNRIHDTYGSQGDGIEIKQGSWGNWVTENYIHDTQYPGILVYGTGGMPPNVIERNVCIRSQTTAMQVQGEAIVRNNLLIGGVGGGLQSHDHQGSTRDLVFVHNTIITQGRGAYLSKWGGRPGMVFANNIVYSQSEAVNFSSGSSGVQIGGNVVVGAVYGASMAGFAQGNGLSDFVGVDWMGTQRLARPKAGSILTGSGDPSFGLPLDLPGRVRLLPLEAGCWDGL